MDGPRKNDHKTVGNSWMAPKGCQQPGWPVTVSSGSLPSLQFKLVIPISMEAMKMKLFVAVVMMVMAVSAVQNVAAVEAPAPSPTSDATIYVPTIVASLSAIAFGLLF
ncbi:unnamed protein product [Ilex paraguariensis]|uniref:Uncharacterized protein n=1 Tax=Ilex paraguariensis TaxID=185542 RepID=A0ABC8RN83_9AQUA